jgi:thymidylate synthase ThyX
VIVLAFKAEVKADSISPDDIRLTTFEATYPRIVHSEMMTHRVFSRNSASTRAIPIATQLLNLLTEPFIPEKFGINQPGMQAYKHLVGLKHDTAVRLWLRGRDRAVTTVLELILGEEQARDLLQYEPNREFVAGDIILEDFDAIKAALPKSNDAIDLEETSMLNVHKQLAGRGLEAYMWHTIVLTGTEFGNFFALRDHPDAQGEIATIARYLREASVGSEPRFINYGEWHLPYVDEGEFTTVEQGIHSSAARAAASSYGRQNVKNPEKEAERYADLRNGGHMSPLEHPATPFDKDEQDFVRQLMAFTLEQASKGKISDLVANERIAASEFSGNYKGWRQHRKFVPSEHNFGALRAA